MRAADLDYELPGDLIAQAPLPARDGARLLVVPARAELAHRRITDLPALVPQALWVVNDTRVIPARLAGSRPTGGRVEVLLVEREGPAGAEETWLAMARSNKPLKPGAEISLGGLLAAQVLDVLPDGLRRMRLVATGGCTTVEGALARVGELPLPPYIERSPDETDADRYQTVFAAHAGAVAAPTAGLHLSEAVLAALAAHGHELCRVTLHVGPGTFAPLRSERLQDHRMHAERYEVPAATAAAVAQAKRDGRPVVAVGTTVVRTLEAAASPAGDVRAGPGRTDIFIYPPHRFRVVDRLLTNFHLPRSTLLALVMAFGGIEPVRAAYAEAVRARYRFFSYGDAMLLSGGTA